MQRAKLRNDEKQKEHAEQDRAQKVLSSLPLPQAAQRKQVVDSIMQIPNSKFVIWNLGFGITNCRGMVSMVSMEVSKTLGPGSSPGTPAIEYF